MKKLMFTLAAASLAGLVQADWIPTAGGTYNYNDSENWDDGTAHPPRPSPAIRRSFSARIRRWRTVLPSPTAASFR